MHDLCPICVMNQRTPKLRNQNFLSRHPLKLPPIAGRCFGHFVECTQADFLTDFGNSITRPRCSEGTHFTFLGKGSGT